MSRLAVISLVIGSLAACGSSGSGSGVTSSKKLTELDPSEREKLCSYVIDIEGGVRTQMCGNIIISVRTAAMCAMDEIAASCTATVDNVEACAEAVGEDLCKLPTDPACSFLLACAGN